MNYKFAQVITVVVALMLASPVVASALEVGDKAPTFSAASTAGEISLSDYGGKQHVILALYFAVFTPV